MAGGRLGAHFSAKELGELRGQDKMPPIISNKAEALRLLGAAKRGTSGLFSELEAVIARLNAKYSLAKSLVSRASGDAGRTISRLAMAALKSRDPSDYQVSILEVAGTVATPDDIIQMETLWKSKLQSRELGLNKN